LEDAYGERAKEGKALEVKWMNVPLHVGHDTLKIPEFANADGTVVPSHEEENHFPGRREFVVKLPLTDDVQTTGDAPAVTMPVESVKPANEPVLQAQPPSSKKSSTPSKSFDLRWLLLLLVPGLILLLRFLHSRLANQ
jgi:hypothetical protein